jgi:hypothetical protein
MDSKKPGMQIIGASAKKGNYSVRGTSFPLSTTVLDDISNVPRRNERTDGSEAHEALIDELGSKGIS